MPSPHELKVHTETIMQAALFKKKMEEEREFRKRQDWYLQQQQKASSFSDGNMQPDEELNRSLSLDLHQSPTKKATFGRKASTGNLSTVPTTSMMREKMTENNIATSKTTVPDNSNGSANANWLASNNSSKDTHKGKIETKKI